MSDIIDYTSLAVVIFNVIVSSAFIVAYHRHRRHAWRHSWFGQSVMILAVAILMFSALGLLSQTLGRGYWGEGGLRLTARSAVAVAMAQRMWVLLRIEQGDRS